MNQPASIFQQRVWLQRCGIITAVSLAIMLGAAPAAATTACEDLAGLALANAKIDSAQMVTAGAFVQPAGRGGVRGGTPAANPFANLPAFCRLTATLTPSSDSDIKTEIWLPASGWNGKYLAVGNGGWAGTIPYPALAAAVAAGYAGAGTDTGHVGNNADFALGHPEKLIDIAYRSIHEMTVQSKTVIKAHYGMAAKFSYYNGCSQGGRQGLAAAQTYPEDFNGIIAGAAAWDQMRAHGARTALNLIVNKDADSIIPPSKYSMIHEAVLNACDALDGLKDGVIENPTKCNFDYAKLACKAGDGASCLTRGQVESAKAMTSPLKDPKTGKVLFEGHLMPGTELGWATLGGPEPLGPASTAMRNIVFQDRNWDYHTMNISTDIGRADKSDKGVMYSGDPNLKPFFDLGGKLLMYHGWSDPQVNPLLSVTYYNNVLKTVGKEKAANSIALFMVPGMNHCQGGLGTDTFNKVKVMEEWVEQGKKPAQIIASHLVDGQVDKTRPLCPFGQVAKYRGTGDTNDASNFSCAGEAVNAASR
jgi:feruloyl esterase